MTKIEKVVVLVGVVVLLLGVAVYYYFTGQEAKVTDPTLLRIKGEGRILVGTDATYPPMEYIDENGEIVGFDIDIAKEIASYLGVSPEIKNIAWDDIFDAVKTGEVDMIISSITVTAERAEEMAFSDPYFNAGQIIVVIESNQDIKSPIDLEGKKIGVQGGTTSETEALKYTNSSLVVNYEDYTPTPVDLKAGKIDAIIIDYPAAVGMVRGTPGLKIVGEPFTQEFYGVAVKKTEQALLTEINKVIRDLKQTGKLHELQNEWL